MTMIKKRDGIYCLISTLQYYSYYWTKLQHLIIMWRWKYEYHLHVGCMEKEGTWRSTYDKVDFNPLSIAKDIQSLVYHWVCYRSSNVRSRCWIDWICNPAMVILTSFRASFLLVLVIKSPFQKKRDDENMNTICITFPSP